MDQQKRTKLLAGGLAGILAFGVLKPQETLMKPIRDAERKLQSAESDLEKAEASDFQLETARERIRQGRETSLPNQSADAQRVYQKWITNLAEQCRFAPLKVVPGRPDSRNGRYLTVDVVVEAETDMEGLSRFLYLFEQADLLHRVTSLDIKSTGATGKPRMEISLTAQGMSVYGSPDRSDVFPLTQLPEATAPADTIMTVADTKGFPTSTPFLVQVGREMVNVTEVNGLKWTVERAQQGTQATAHVADEYVQLFPISYRTKDVTFEDYAALVQASPFVKPEVPRQRTPRLTSITDKTIAPGETVSMTAKVEDIDPDVGEVVFVLEDPTDGMSIDAESGEFSWAPAGDLAPETYSTNVVVTQKNNPDLKLEKKLNITIKLPNDAPQITVPEKGIVVLGREFHLTATATDDGPASALKFALDGSVPEGLTVDATSGKLSWTPPKTFTPGDYPVTVKVTDGGSPARSATGAVTLTVKDDTAEFTRFTGSVTLDGQQLAFFRNLVENVNPQLKVGDHITAAEIDAEVKEVARRHVLLADAEGIWRLNLGDNLRQRQLIEPAAPPEDSKAEPEATQPSDSTSSDNQPTAPAEQAEPSTAEQDETAKSGADAEEPAANSEGASSSAGSDVN
ncbi:MAG: putative Ig domain-containing protein [Planctomycetaceae bacterium]